MLSAASKQAIYETLTDAPSQATWDRFCAKIACRNESDCWEWQGAKHSGYGRFQVHGAPRAAHRVLMVWIRGEVPSELVVDHLCKNRGCVNPNHLEVVTRGINVVRSNSVTGVQSRQQYCKNGHPLHGDNLRIDGHSRRCKLCRKTYNYDYGKKRKRINGIRRPVELSASMLDILADPRFESVRREMGNAPDEKTWARFLGKITIDHITKCWEFPVAINEVYGQFSHKTKTWRAHRIMKFWMDGNLPAGYDVHHVCNNPSCVNPDHLENLKPKANILESETTQAGRNSQKIRCPKEHPYAGDNLMMSGGKRLCRTCHTAKSRNYPADKKRKAALKSYYKKMEDPAFRESQRQRSAEYRKMHPDRINAAELRRRQERSQVRNSSSS
jgi:hypothetical protein